MFGSNVHSTIKPADRPPVKVETVEYGSKEPRYFSMSGRVSSGRAAAYGEDALIAIIESQVSG